MITRGGGNLRESIHKGICEIPVPQKEIVLQCQEVVEQLEFIKEDVKEPLACDFISCVDGFF